MNYKRQNGEWEELEVGPKVTNYVIRGLTCGSTYEVYVTSVNRIGVGQPSEVARGFTKGNRKIFT